MFYNDDIDNDEAIMPQIDIIWIYYKGLELHISIASKTFTLWHNYVNKAGGAIALSDII